MGTRVVSVAEAVETANKLLNKRATINAEIDQIISFLTDIKAEVDSEYSLTRLSEIEGCVGGVAGELHHQWYDGVDQN